MDLNALAPYGTVHVYSDTHVHVSHDRERGTQILTSGLPGRFSTHYVDAWLPILGPEVRDDLTWPEVLATVRENHARD